MQKKKKSNNFQQIFYIIIITAMWSSFKTANADGHYLHNSWNKYNESTPVIHLINNGMKICLKPSKKTHKLWENLRIDTHRRLNKIGNNSKKNYHSLSNFRQNC